MYADNSFSLTNWNDWSSESIPFESNEKCVGNGERKFVSEFNINQVGGQNSCVDCLIPQFANYNLLPNVSVKDVTNNSDVRLGVDTKEGFSIIRYYYTSFILNISILHTHIYTISQCNNNEYNILNNNIGLQFINLIQNFNNDLNLCHNKLRNKNTETMTLKKSILRDEIAPGNLSKLDFMINQMSNFYYNNPDFNFGINFMKESISYFMFDTLKNKLTLLIREEAIKNTLICVHKKKGWIIVNPLSIYCSRITQGGPKFMYDLPN